MIRPMLPAPAVAMFAARLASAARPASAARLASAARESPLAQAPDAGAMTPHHLQGPTADVGDGLPAQRAPFRGGTNLNQDLRRTRQA